MGALITGIDLRGEGSTTRRKRLYALLLEPLGLFLPDQGLTPATLLAFAATFGALATRTMSSPQAVCHS